MFAGIINGIEVENVVIYGEGLVDGQASFENWWNDVGTMRGFPAAYGISGEV